MPNDALGRYLTDIGRYPLLDKHQEIILSRQVRAWTHTEEPTPKQVKAGKRAYHKLINCNLRLVVSIAKRSTAKIKRSELLDLIQEGNCGLAHGIKKFDPERGYALSTYVYWWIRQSISRYVSCSDRLIRLPSHAVEMMAKLRMWTPKFEQEFGRMPTLAECAEYCSTTPARMRMYMDNAHDSISLDARVSSTDGDSTLMQLIAGDINLMDDLDISVRSDFLVGLLDRLEPVDRALVEGHFALGGGEPMTLQAMGQQFGFSRERARQKFNKAMLKLQILATHARAL
jgi:RNA polymerase sigma factor (sigma-70 family)